MFGSGRFPPTLSNGAGPDESLRLNAKRGSRGRLLSISALYLFFFEDREPEVQQP